METRHIGVILNGVTGRMGTNQHLVRSIMEIIKQGGVTSTEGPVLMPVPILTGRNGSKLKMLADTYGAEVGGGLRWTTDISEALADKTNEIFFDASATLLRKKFLDMAIEAKKSVYCEKPTATDTATALTIARNAEKAGVKNGVVQDKLWLPGLLTLQSLIRGDFFGDILSVRGDFGYWVFTGLTPDQPPQRPSWNYRAEDGGGILVDMFCHWRYVLENLFGEVEQLVTYANTDIPVRVDEKGNRYSATAEDSAYAIFLLKNGITCRFDSSWCTRVRRDDLLTIQVDGTKGSALAGLRDVWTQSAEQTPRVVWNPDMPQTVDYFGSWRKMEECDYDNAFKAQWELFLRHHALDEPFPWTLMEGAKGVQLAELGMKSWREHAWVDVPDIEKET